MEKGISTGKFVFFLISPVMYKKLVLIISLMTITWVQAEPSSIKFSSAKSHSVGFSFFVPSIESQGAATADFDNDGFQDVVLIAPWYGLSISLMWGNGDGSFKRDTTFIGILNSNVICGDFNSDGLIDIAVTGTSTITILINKGEREFKADQTYLLQQSPAQNSGFTADINGDGILDLVVRSFMGIHTMFGYGDGRFRYGPAQIIPGTVIFAITSIAQANLNGDGIVDLVLTDALASQVIALEGVGNGTFRVVNRRTLWGVPAAVLAGDLDGTGLDSVVALAEIAPGWRSVGVFMNNGTGYLTESKLHRGGFANPNGLLADFNADGHLDIVSVKVINGAVEILLGEGNGSYHPGGSFRVGLHPQTPVAADFNGDSKVDLAVPVTCPLNDFRRLGHVCLSVLLNES